jgi:release factor glutamine methyltransferase
MLADALRVATLPPRASVLDLCSGSGALALAAALRGAREVTAVDVSRRAVLAVRLNARANGVRVRALRGDLFAPVARSRFDLILSNPPYVPAEDDGAPGPGRARHWAGGGDGRALLDRIIDEAPAHLRPGGSLMLVHSSLCGIDATLDRMRAAGLAPEVVARRRGPLGPLMSARVQMLERRGLLRAGQREEEVAVLRAKAPAGASR